MTNTWQEQAFDKPTVDEPVGPHGLIELDTEIRGLSSDLSSLTAMLKDRTEQIQALRRQVADIARTLP